MFKLSSFGNQGFGTIPNNFLHIFGSRNTDKSVFKWIAPEIGTLRIGSQENSVEIDLNNKFHVAYQN